MGLELVCLTKLHTATSPSNLISHEPELGRRFRTLDSPQTRTMSYPTRYQIRLFVKPYSPMDSVLPMEVIRSILQLGHSHPEGFNSETLNEQLEGVSTEDKKNALNSLLKKGWLIPLDLKGTTIFKLQSKEEIKRFEGLSPNDLTVYYIIREAERNGIWLKDIKSKTGNALSENSVKRLVQRGLVKRVPGIQRKFFMLAELTPPEDLTGNVLHSGNIDLGSLKEMCLRFTLKKGVVTVQDVAKLIKESGNTSGELSIRHYQQVLSALALDGDLEEVISTGMGEFASIPPNARCYRASKGGMDQFTSAFTSVPCGVCPILHQCTPEGTTISPTTCVYFQEWLKW